MRRIALLIACMAALAGCDPRSLFTLSPIVIILPGGKQIVAINSTESHDNRKADAATVRMPPPELDERELITDPEKGQPEPEKKESKPWVPLL